MSNRDLTCGDERRRQNSRERNLNGIDYIEVGADEVTLCVHLFGDVPEKIDKASVLIEGGRRVRDIKVIDVYPEREDDPALGECLRVIVDKPGDFSTYKLCIVEAMDGKPSRRPREDFDPRYSCAEFSFKVNCPTDLDCRTEQACPPEERNEPEINYLAKDYASFRQLILDRLALLMPDWKERHAPDIGITLVEVLAYVGDYLSYYQDAVGTEAYLNTARQRISVRRHARLVDYQMHEGCNARAWVSVETGSDCKLDSGEFFFVTNCAELERAGSRALKAEEFKRLGIPSGHYDVFEPVAAQKVDFDLGGIKSKTGFVNQLQHSEDEFTKRLRARLSSNTQYLLAEWDGHSNMSEMLHAALTDEWQQVQSAVIFIYEAHSPIHFYDWGDAECCLPRGATRATLKDGWGPEPSAPGHKVTTHHEIESHNTEPTANETHAEKQRRLRLRVGDVLIFEEVKGTGTGNPSDADFTHRHAVRLTKVEPDVDPLSNQPIVEIEWHEEDALPFSLCISAVLPAPDCRLVEDISVAHGNVILVDHGKTIDLPDQLGQVPLKTITGKCECGSTEVTRVPGRFRPVLKYSPLTFSQAIDASLPASAMLIQDPRQASAQITKLTGLPGVCPESNGVDDSAQQLMTAPQDDSDWQWYPRRDLLSSQSDDRHFVAEIDNDGRAHLRFGDGESGQRPEACAKFEAIYRVGNGAAGNVGADTITHLIFRSPLQDASTMKPRNPLAAHGGVDPEPVSEVKLFAPGAINKDRQRAITADDYARLTEGNKKVQRASAELRWTGSWYAARVAVDPADGEELVDELRNKIKGYLYPYRRIGHDLTIVPARYVPLEIELTVCVLPHYQRGHVKAALLDAFSSRVLSNNQRGFFHPDNLTFGDGVYLSQLIAAAQSIQGVESVAVTKLERRFAGADKEIENGILSLNATEVAQLDTDPSFPEYGKLNLVMNGGR